MSNHSQIRKDKTCLNCKHVVENKFCPNCGQKNEDTRKTFHHLFIHFFEDLTHYEGAFWKTIKNLLFKPAALTIEYLSGKRLSYLAPVRLYLFISFLTFLTISLLPEDKESFVKINESKPEIKDSISQSELKVINLQKEGRFTKKESDSIIKYIQESKKKKVNITFGNKKYASINELDSIQKFGKQSEKLSSTKYWIVKKLIKPINKYSTEELIEKFKKSFVSNLPKVLFIYMPIFAMALWFFHGKKRWYYFDHGIFTLHYFSFLLLMSFIYVTSEALVYALLSENDFITNTFEIIAGIMLIWSIIYFYKSHRRFYTESKRMSFLKSSILLLLNFILISLILIFYIIYTFINIK